MDFKPTVVLDLEREMCKALPVIERVHQAVGISRGAFITSARDSVHNVGSLHPKGLAVDLRTKDLSPTQKGVLAAGLQKELGKDFDVVLEVDHIHVEYDPEV
jgi:hypothetical protein